MRTSTRQIKPQFQKTALHGVRAVIELHISEMKINLIGEHCKHCRTEKNHLLKLDTLEITNH